MRLSCFWLFLCLIAANSACWAVDYFEAPARVAVSSLPPADQQRYAATGKLVCPVSGPEAGRRIEAFAQLTLKNTLITTAAHVFIDPFSCVQKDKPESCKLLIGPYGSEREFQVDKLLGMGLLCPRKAFEFQQDWAVLKLREPVDGIEPYPVEPDIDDALRMGQTVVSVAQSNDFWAGPSGESGPKHFSKCQVLKVYQAGVSTACGCSEGCSGGSLLSPEVQPKLLGVMDQNDDPDGNIPRKHPKIVHWQEDKNGSYFVVLKDEFLGAVLRAAVDPDQAQAALTKAGLTLAMKPNVASCSAETDPFHGCVIVKAISQGSVASRLGFVSGDVIAWVGSENVTTLDRLLQEVSISQLKQADKIDLLVMRSNGSRASITLPLP